MKRRPLKLSEDFFPSPEEEVASAAPVEVGLTSEEEAMKIILGLEGQGSRRSTTTAERLRAPAQYPGASWARRGALSFLVGTTLFFTRAPFSVWRLLTSFARSGGP